MLLESGVSTLDRTPHYLRINNNGVDKEEIGPKVATPICLKVDHYIWQLCQI
jgi:hypothetical protein